MMQNPLTPVPPARRFDADKPPLCPPCCQQGGPHPHLAHLQCALDGQPHHQEPKRHEHVHSFRLDKHNLILNARCGGSSHGPPAFGIGTFSGLAAGVSWHSSVFWCITTYLRMTQATLYTYLCIETRNQYSTNVCMYLNVTDLFDDAHCIGCYPTFQAICHQ